MNVIILRFFFVYGPGQKQNMLIPRLINSVKERKSISLQGKDGIRINPTYVSDVAEAVFHSLDLIDSHQINVGGPEILTMREIGEKIGNHLGIEPVFEMQENVEPKHIIGDINKMKRLLWAPEITFDAGLSKIT